MRQHNSEERESIKRIEQLLRSSSATITDSSMPEGLISCAVNNHLRQHTGNLRMRSLTPLLYTCIACLSLFLIRTPLGIGEKHVGRAEAFSPHGISEMKQDAGHPSVAKNIRLRSSIAHSTKRRHKNRIAIASRQRITTTKRLIASAPAHPPLWQKETVYTTTASSVIPIWVAEPDEENNAMYLTPALVKIPYRKDVQRFRANDAGENSYYTSEFTLPDSSTTEEKNH